MERHRVRRPSCTFPSPLCSGHHPSCCYGRWGRCRIYVAKMVHSQNILPTHHSTEPWRLHRNYSPTITRLITTLEAHAGRLKRKKSVRRLEFLCHRRAKKRPKFTLGLGLFRNRCPTCRIFDVVIPLYVSKEIPAILNLGHRFGWFTPLFRRDFAEFDALTRMVWGEVLALIVFDWSKKLE